MYYKAQKLYHNEATIVGGDVGGSSGFIRKNSDENIEIQETTQDAKYSSMIQEEYKISNQESQTVGNQTLKELIISKSELRSRLAIKPYRLAIDNLRRIR